MPSLLSNLVLIQRRLDPISSSSASQDVYGFVDNVNVYKFTADAPSNTITASQQIALPVNGVFITTNMMIDVGLYQLAVYSAANCAAVAGQTAITGSSAWFYTFSTQQWSCMDLANSPTTQSLAWTH